MTLPLRTADRLKNNNLDLLRLLFAATVCLIHSYQLSGFAELAVIEDVLSSGVAVKSFFIVSGFLIFMSYERSSTFASYAKKRLLRVYPAYVVVVLLCATLLYFVSTKPAAEYFSLAWFKYLAANLTFMNMLQPSLPGVFATNKLSAVNGALWTLKIEVMFYVSVPIFVFLFRKIGRLPVLVLTYGASLAYVAVLTAVAERTGSPMYAELARQLPGQLSYFMAGACIYYYLAFFERWVAYFLAGSIAVLLVNAVYPLALLAPFALASTVLFFGLFLYAGKFGKYGDFSYGMYIVHFPVIQTLLWSGWFQGKPWQFLATVVAITAVGAVLMWNLIEKRFLHRTTASAAPALRAQTVA